MILRALLIIVAVLVAAVVVQSVRLHFAKAQLASLEREYAAAQVENVIKGATSATDALENYVERHEQDAPVVERVVERVRNVCLHSESRVPLPAGAGTLSGAGARTRDDEDRARDERFVEAIEHDLAYCNDKLNVLRGLQQFCIANGCAERPGSK